jgi:hypothetical protein
MGHAEPGPANDPASIEQQVQVQDSGFITLMGWAPNLTFDREQVVNTGKRRFIGIGGYYQIEEPTGARHVHRVGFVSGRTPHQPKPSIPE